MRCLSLTSFGTLAGLTLVLSGCSGAGGGKLPPQGAASYPAPVAVPEAVVPAAAPSNKPIVDYTIQTGDSLWKIARAYKTTVKEIKDANQLTSDNIVAGQSLRVPSGLPEGTTPETAQPAVSSQGLPQPAAMDAAGGLVR